MKFFYISTLPNAEGLYEVHEKECENIPDSIDRDYLGPFNNGNEALRKATLKNPSSILCQNCCGNYTQPIIFSKRSRESTTE